MRVSVPGGSGSPWALGGCYAALVPGVAQNTRRPSPTAQATRSVSPWAEPPHSRVPRPASGEGAGGGRTTPCRPGVLRALGRRGGPRPWPRHGGGQEQARSRSDASARCRRRVPVRGGQGVAGVGGAHRRELKGLFQCPIPSCRLLFDEERSRHAALQPGAYLRFLMEPSPRTTTDKPL